jgi:hypothetical protein
MSYTTDRYDLRLPLHTGADEQPVSQDDVYLILSAEERTRGFVRPLRRAYRHVVNCGGVTTMGIALCETYARDPRFYSHTYCAVCQRHRLVEEFVWVEDNTEVGT